MVRWSGAVLNHSRRLNDAVGPGDKLQTAIRRVLNLESGNEVRCIRDDSARSIFDSFLSIWIGASEILV